MRQSLLTPSLSSKTAPSTALYSVQSAFLVAFFGGAFAIILYSALNSWKLRRPLDPFAYAIAAALVLALNYAIVVGWAPLATLFATLGEGLPRYLMRTVSLLLFGAFYLLHRKQHRSSSLFAVAPLSPWIPAIACMVAGYGINYGLSQLLTGGAA